EELQGDEGTLATCPPSIIDRASKWSARFDLPALRTSLGDQRLFRSSINAAFFSAAFGRYVIAMTATPFAPFPVNNPITVALLATDARDFSHQLITSCCQT